MNTLAQGPEGRMDRKAWLEAADDCIEQIPVTCTCYMCNGEFTQILEFDWVNACDALHDGLDTIYAQRAFDNLLAELEQERAEAIEALQLDFLCQACQEREAAEYERQVNADWYYDRI
mgnify:CR=1 FL=1